MTQTIKTSKSLTTEQFDAIHRYSTNKGRNWKAALRKAWRDGYYDGDFYNTDDKAYLQQIRNTLGVDWLRTIQS